MRTLPNDCLVVVDWMSVDFVDVVVTSSLVAIVKMDCYAMNPMM